MHALLEHNNNNSDSVQSPEEDLHAQANKYISEAHVLVFQTLPQIMAKIIEHKIWQEKNHANFGEYALNASSNGLSITNNHKLLLLKCAMDIDDRHAIEWGDLLNEVDNSVRNYAKDNKISVKDLRNNLNKLDDKDAPHKEAITYLPSRSKSSDSQLLKLRKENQEAYNDVVTGKITLKEAFPPRQRKSIDPIELAKSKFNNLSETDREVFLKWIEQQKRD